MQQPQQQPKKSNAAKANFVQTKKPLASAQPSSKSAQAQAQKLDAKPKPKKDYKKLKKRLIIAGSIIGGLILVVAIASGIIWLMYGTDFKNAYSDALTGKSDLEHAQDFIKKQEFPEAKTSIASARTDFQSAQQAITHFSWMNVIPLVHRQLFSVDQLLTASIQLTGTLDTLVGSTQRIMAPLKSTTVTDFHSLSSDQKRDVLAAFHEETPVFEDVKGQLQVAQKTIDSIPDFGTIRQIRDIKATATSKLPEFEKAIDDLLVFSKILPDIAGYKSEKPYLFLFQNNTELRPGGGFIGTYGILTLANGEIKNFTTDNVYNLDKEGHGDPNPPGPIKQYINKQWFFRDANWSPDFPTSAQKAEEFYHSEGGKGNFAGVIAVTPSLLQSLLEVTGPIKVAGYSNQFTKDNTVDQLEYIVERGFNSLGLPEKDRKDIIGAFSSKVLDELFKLPKEKWLDFGTLVIDEFHKKQAAIYVHDSAIQQVLEDQDWDSRIKTTDGDYVEYVDANLASLKSDPAVKRSIDYEVDASNLDNITATVTMTYNHTGKFDWKTTRYNTYTRLYAPDGSQFLALGGQKNSGEKQYNDATKADITSELGKSVFGGYKSIEPGHTETMSFQYKLPARIADQIRNGTYTLIFQKEAGTPNNGLHIHLKFNKTITDFSPKEMGKIKNNNEIDFNTDLTYDRSFSVTF